MSIPTIYNSITYNIPQYSDEGWGPDVTDYLVALATGSLTRSGGLFTLTSDVDFGGTYGLRAGFFSTGSANPALTGSWRLSNNEQITWRNQANTADLPLYVNSANQLTFNGEILGGNVTWGSIQGTLSNQTDLQAALNLKLDSSALVWGPIQGTLSNQTDLQNALNLKATVVDLNALTATVATKAPIASPTFTGTVTLPSTVIPLTGYLYGNGAGAITSSLTIPTSVLTGVLPVANGGTGTSTITGLLRGNGTSAITGGSSVSLTSEVNGVLPIVNGGTGQNTQQLALNALAGGVTNQRVLQGNGTNVTLSQINLAGTAVTGILPAANVAAAGSNTEIQFNNSGVLGASANLRYAGTTLSVNRFDINGGTVPEISASAAGSIVPFFRLRGASTTTGSVVSGGTEVRIGSLVPGGSNTGGAFLVTAGGYDVGTVGERFGAVLELEGGQSSPGGGRVILNGGYHASTVATSMMGGRVNITPGFWDGTGGHVELLGGGAKNLSDSGAKVLVGGVGGLPDAGIELLTGHPLVSRLKILKTGDWLLAGSAGTTGQVLTSQGAGAAPIWSAVGGTGTVTSVAASGSNGVSISGSPITTSGTITIGLGNITPTSVAASGTVTGSNLSGTNTGDQTITLTGDVTGSGTGSFAATLANTAVTPGTYTNATLTVDAKGRLTAASNGSAGGVTSFNTRTGAVTLSSSDVTTALGFTPASNAITVSAGTGLSGGGDLSANRTISLANTAVSAGSYTNANITVDAQGRLTSASNGTAGLVAPNYEEFVASAAQTVFNTTMTTTAKASGKAYLQVYVNGVFQQEGASKAFTVTGTTQLTFNAGLALNDDVAIFGYA